MTYVPKVDISHVKTVKVECEGCDPGAKPSQWTRERARQHAAFNGHIVWYTTEDATIYQPFKDGAQ